MSPASISAGLAHPAGSASSADPLTPRNVDAVAPRPPPSASLFRTLMGYPVQNLKCEPLRTPDRSTEPPPPRGVCYAVFKEQTQTTGRAEPPFQGFFTVPRQGQV
ncbi:hypothetical protein AAFF_G00119970 [Aldrovandia affinis]|uniref:Uncharacterized protein n=1 Tax=Aldrovandia affinis TaxID=143900 RepID=A0AAD7WB46_9TELE|nr:hypothetical protein AAFF_G00119970 [Aldrovandia affinis]